MEILEGNTDLKNQLRISLNGNWSNVDFINFLTAIQNLYELYIISDELESFKSRKLKSAYRKQQSALIITYIEKNFIGSELTVILGDTFNDVYVDDNLFRLDFNLKEELRVLKIKYASPGFADLGGVGAAIGHIKEIILRLIDLFENRKIRKLDARKKEIENELLELSKTGKIVELLRSINYPESKIIKLLESEEKSILILDELIEKKKIENAK